MKEGSKIISYIPISDLIDLWDLGYTYQNYPIVEYKHHRFERSLTYIKDEKLIKITGFTQENLGFSAVLRGVLEYITTHHRIFTIQDEYKTIQNMKNILSN